MQIGERIQKLRKKRGLTQAALAERLFVTPQAVSQWERDITIPDTDKLADIAAALHTTVNKLTDGEAVGQDWTIADALFSPEHMYSRIAVTSELEGLRETSAALRFMKKAHEGQYRKPSLFSDTKVPYITHPLMMACHAHALGIRGDSVLATVMLHDVCEDCGISPEELPFPQDIRHSVALLTKHEGQPTAEYYAGIMTESCASIVKALDRCNNVSTMAQCFSREKLVEYTQETEQYVYPLLEHIKNEYLEYNDAVFVIKYQILSLIESIKAMLISS